jgi:hypothetical protein
MPTAMASAIMHLVKVRFFIESSEVDSRSSVVTRLLHVGGVDGPGSVFSASTCVRDCPK